MKVLLPGLGKMRAWKTLFLYSLTAPVKVKQLIDCLLFIGRRRY